MANPDNTIYRTSGAWGAGKGANLAPEEVDENFYRLALRIAGLEDNPVPGVGIAEFSVTGTSLTVQLTDGSTRGPFTLPAASFRWTGEWAPGTVYNFMDIFTVTQGGAHDGLYWVIGEQYEAPEDSTEPAVFDPLASSTEEGTLLQLILPGALPPSRIPILNVEEGLILGDEDAGKYVRINSPDPATVYVDLEANVPYVVGDFYGIRQVGDGSVDIAGLDSSITINVPVGLTLTLRGVGASATLTYCGFDEWDISGDLEPEA